jgi:HD domain
MVDEDSSPMDRHVPETRVGTDGEMSLRMLGLGLGPSARKPPGKTNGPTVGTEAILLTLAQAVERRDSPTARHCERLAFTCVALGTALKLSQPNLVALYRGAFLHDVGKVGIPDEILLNPTRLTPKQWIVMRTHTTFGEQICSHIPALTPVLPIIRHHHERFDGSGYPDGLRGAQIPLLARVLQIADIYDALTSARPYKPAYSVREALQIIEKETTQGWRDPEIVNLFFRLHGDVISRIHQLTQAGNDRFEEIRQALASLNAALAVDAIAEGRLGLSSLNGRTSVRPLQCARLDGSGQAAMGRLHTA